MNTFYDIACNNTYNRLSSQVSKLIQVEIIDILEDGTVAACYDIPMLKTSEQKMFKNIYGLINEITNIISNKISRLELNCVLNYIEFLYDWFMAKSLSARYGM